VGLLVLDEEPLDRAGMLGPVYDGQAAVYLAHHPAVAHAVDVAEDEAELALLVIDEEGTHVVRQSDDRHVAGVLPLAEGIAALHVHGAGARLGLAVVREALDLVADRFDGDPRLAVLGADHAVDALALARGLLPGLALFRLSLVLRGKCRRPTQRYRQ